MKVGVLVLVLPRHIIWTFIFLCSCHLVFLLNWISLNSPEYRYRTRLDLPPNINYVPPLTQDKDPPVNPAASLQPECSYGSGKSCNQSERTRLGGEKDLSSVANPLTFSSHDGGNGSAAGTVSGKSSLLAQFFTAEGYPEADLRHALKKYYISAESPSALLLNISSFRFLSSPNFLCDINDDSPNGTFLLVTVHSEPLHRPQRDAIRATWGEIRRNFNTPLQTRLLFVLGLPTNAHDSQAISREALLFRDVIIGDFLDAYSNLTLKSLYGLYWASKFCASAKFLLKTDDDSYVFVPKLLNLLLDTNPSILGALNYASPVMRKGLWAVNKEKYPFPKYPPYCTGCAYVVSMETVVTLLAVAPYVPLVPIEDVHITGILPLLVNQTCKNSFRFPQWHMGPSRSHLCDLVNGKLLGVHNVPFEKMYKIHALVTASQSEAHKLINCSDFPT